MAVNCQAGIGCSLLCICGADKDALRLYGASFGDNWLRWHQRTSHRHWKRTESQVNCHYFCWRWLHKLRMASRFLVGSLPIWFREVANSAGLDISDSLILDIWQSFILPWVSKYSSCSNERPMRLLSSRCWFVWLSGGSINLEDNNTLSLCAPSVHNKHSTCRILPKIWHFMYAQKLTNPVWERQWGLNFVNL